MYPGVPPKQGLYDPQFERDSCGVGFVVDVHGRKTNDIVRKALQVLINMQHRGAKGSEENTGDGAGILIQVPHDFLGQECLKLGIQLPAAGDYGVGMVSLPPDADSQRQCEAVFASLIEKTGQKLLGWRDVPTNNGSIGDSAKAFEPVCRQIFIGRGENAPDRETFERKLFLIRKRVENAVRASQIPGRNYFYLASLSANTL